MMYIKPDFIKVDVDVKDNFAAYGACSAKYGVTKIFTNVPVGCDDTFDYQYTNTYPQIFEAQYQCWENKDEV